MRKVAFKCPGCFEHSYHSTYILKNGRMIAVCRPCGAKDRRIEEGKGMKFKEMYKEIRKVKEETDKLNNTFKTISLEIDDGEPIFELKAGENNYLMIDEFKRLFKEIKILEEFCREKGII